MLSPGDIVLLDFPYTNQTGSKVRPGLVLNSNPHNKLEDVNVAYITTEVDAYAHDPAAIALNATDMAEGTLKQTSVARVDKVLTIHSSKRGPGRQGAHHPQQQVPQSRATKQQKN